MATRRDLTQESPFGKWTVLGPSAKPRYWDCRCACGTERAVFGPSLTNGTSSSCGCVLHEAFAKMWTKHGHAMRHGHEKPGAQSREYETWCRMRARCERPTASNFHLYGGRGIYVCARWRASFDAFLRDVGYKPGPGYSIDRIDVNGSYTCGKCAQCVERGASANVRWATAKEQARNRRSSTHIEHNGERLTIAEWAERLGIRPERISQRHRDGMSPAEALSTCDLRPYVPPNTPLH